MHRLLTSIVTATALGVAATPALAADYGAQKTIRTAGQTSPLTVGGTGIKKGTRLKTGQTMLKRTATLEGREKGSMVLTCARGAGLQGLASEEAGRFGWAVASKESYVGKRSVRVNLVGRAAAGETTDAALYAICRWR